MYFVKNTAVAGQWDVYATMTNPASATNPGVLDLSRDANGDGVVSPAEAAAAPVALGSLFFNTSGTLASTTPAAGLVQALTAAQIGSTGINANAMSFKVDFAGSTQFGSNFAVNTLEQDGFTAGSLAGYSVGADGIIVGRYTNGITKNLGQVTLDSFRNPQGLDPIGNNQWVETSDSGAPITGDPGTDGNHGPIQSAATEDSNVDLTQELVNMIIAQRVYQANAQTIKTQDSILQTLVNLR
jgi:flagellar hook protein FlgE